MQETFLREEVRKIICATIMTMPRVGKGIIKGDNLGDRAANVLDAWDSTKGSTDQFTIVATNNAIKKV